MLFKPSKSAEERSEPSKLFYKDRIILMTKPVKDITTKENYKLHMNISILDETLVTRIQQNFKRIYFLPGRQKEFHTRKSSNIVPHISQTSGTI